MIKLKFIFVVFLLSLTTLLHGQTLEDILQKSQRVMDFAHVLSSEMIATLNDSLYHFEQTTSNQIIILTLENIPDEEDEFSFSMKVAEKLKIGQAKKDNGVFVLLTTGKNRVFKIYPGRGLEGAIPDALIDRFFRNVVRPLLKKGDYDQAMMETFSMIAAASRGEYSASNKTNQEKIPIEYIFLIIFFFLLFFIFLSRISRYSKQVTTIEGHRKGTKPNTSTPKIFPLFFGGGRSSGGSGINFGNFHGGGGSFGGGGGGGSW